MGIFYKLFGPSPQVLARKKDVQGLIKVLKKEEDENVRVDAIEALGMIGDARGVEPLIQALKDKDDDVRRRAAGALGTIGGTRSPANTTIYWVTWTWYCRLKMNGQDMYITCM